MKGAQIRSATLADLPRITEIYNYAVLNTVGTFDLTPKTLEQQTEWFTHHGPRHPVFVGVHDGQLAGYACLSAFSDRCAYQDTAEVSIYVAPEFHRKGWGTQLLSHLISAAREREFSSLVSRIAEGNDASFIIHKKFGFFEAGKLLQVGKKFGRNLDVHFWQLLTP